VVVSLVTPRQPKDKLDSFYSLIATPVEPGEPEPAVPCTLPEGVEPRRARRLLPVAGLEILCPSHVSIAGFCVCVLIVAALVGSVIWIAKG
jgi:hypothetical protein